MKDTKIKYNALYSYLLRKYSYAYAIFKTFSKKQKKFLLFANKHH